MNRRSAQLLLASAAIALTSAVPASAQDHSRHADHSGHQPATPAPSEPQADPHADHAMDHGPVTAAGSLPPPIPTDHAADATYGADAMAASRHHLSHMHGGQSFARLLIDRAEVKIRDGQEGYAWEGEFWYGGDIDRLVIASEGEGTFDGPLESAEVRALYSRALDPYFNLLAGVRHDFEPGPSRTYATVGIEGLAPGFFELEGLLFLSDKGDLRARIEGSYDQRITQRLILQPSVELELAAQDMGEIGVGSGLSTAELGARLRYDIAREFAPYIGVEYSRAFGDTKRFRLSEGEKADEIAFVAGIRFWF